MSHPPLYICICTNSKFHQITKLMIGALQKSVSSTHTHTRFNLVTDTSVMVSGTERIHSTCSQSVAGVDSRGVARDSARGGGVSVFSSNTMIPDWLIVCAFCNSASLPQPVPVKPYPTSKPSPMHEAGPLHDVLGSIG